MKSAPIALFSALLFLLAESCYASSWTLITTSKMDEFHFKLDTFTMEQDDDSSTIYLTILGRQTSLIDGSIKFEKLRMFSEDCDDGIGVIILLTVGGQRIKEIDYVSEGGSAGSHVGDAICNLYFASVAAAKKDSEQ